MSSTPNDTITIGKFTFACDERGELVSVPSDPHLQAYVVWCEEKTEYARFQLFTPEDSTERERLGELWQLSHRARATSIFPEIIDCGEDDGIPFYVSKFPHGEPLAIYLEDSPPWPGQVAARMLCRFIASMKFQEDIPINQHLISYDSLWIEKTIYGPRLLIGDIALFPSDSASTDNAALILSVFKDLTKEDQNDPTITALFKKLSQGPMSLGVVEKALKNFSISGDSRDIDWSADNDPAPILDSCIARVDQVSGDQLIESKERANGVKAKFSGFGKFLISHTHYRSPVELDPVSSKVRIPRGLIKFCLTMVVLSAIAYFGFFTDPGKLVFEKVGGWMDGFSYEPTLVLPGDSEGLSIEPVEASLTPEAGLESQFFGDDPIVISLNGSLLDAEGLFNGTFVTEEESINKMTAAN